MLLNTLPIEDVNIARIINPTYYSKELKKSKEQFQDDVSKLYTLGYSYDQVSQFHPLKNAHKYLKDVFWNEFPSLRDFINLTFTRDEVYNPFGRFFIADYFEPIKLLIYANHLSKTSFQGERISIIKLASLLFLIIQYRSYTTDQRISERKDELERKANDDKSEYEKSVLAILKKSTQREKAVEFRKPNEFYSMLGVADSRSFITYAETIGLEFAFNKENKGKYQSSLWIFGNEQIISAYTNFTMSYNNFNEIVIDQVNMQSSGVEFKAEDTARMEFYFKTVLIRDKQIISHNYLKKNPLISIQKNKGRMNFIIQSGFYDFGFIIRSLYVRKRNNRLYTLNIIPNYLQDTRSIQKAINLAKFRKVEDRISSFDFNILPKPIDTPITLNSKKHFDQIRKTHPITNKLSSYGILMEPELLRRRLKYNQEMVKKDFNFEYGEKEKEILTIRSYLESIDQGINRLHGIFSAHGASTHRMTCRAVNLQGIKKELRKKYSMPPEGSVLLSADVTAQDFTIAANLALNIFTNSFKTYFKNSKEYQNAKKAIIASIKKLSDKNDPKHKIIDYITNAASKEIDTSNLRSIDPDNELTLRNMIKEAFYTKLYGGGERTSIGKDKLTLSNFRFKIQMLEIGIITLNEAISFDILDYDKNKVKIGKITKTNIEKALTTLFAIINEIENYYKGLNKNIFIKIFWDETIEKFRSNINTVYLLNQLRNKRIKTIEFVTDIVKKEFPGVLESFKVYQEYYKDKQLTFPTLLGWQTPVVSDEFGDQITKSMNYPIQASGAEFIREWLIVLDEEIRNKFPNQVHIVNVIHDQIVIEAKSEIRSKAAKLLIATSKKAAKNLGINPKTLHLPEVKITM